MPKGPALESSASPVIWVWPVVRFAYMTALAWLRAFVTYQLGTALGW